jgi:hypothetical protein
LLDKGWHCNRHHHAGGLADSKGLHVVPPQALLEFPLLRLSQGSFPDITRISGGYCGKMWQKNRFLWEQSNIMIKASKTALVVAAKGCKASCIGPHFNDFV